jgi:hypothetical protein
MTRPKLDDQMVIMSCLVSAIAQRYSRSRSAQIVSNAVARAALLLQPVWGMRANADTLLKFGVDARRQYFRVKDLRKGGKYYPVQVPIPEMESLLGAVAKVLSETRYEQPLGFENRLTEYFHKRFCQFMGPPPGHPPRKGAAILSAKAAYGRRG